MYIRNSEQSKIDFSKYSGDTDRVNLANLNWRFIPLYVMIALVFGFLFFHLFNTQIIEGQEFLLIASRTNQIETRILPPRGLIFDNNGTKLAYNSPSYTIFISPSEIDQDIEQDVINEISLLVNANSDELWEKYSSKVFNSEGKRLYSDRVTIAAGISFEQYIAALTTMDNISGLYIEAEPVRVYTYGDNFAHILGYIGDPTEADVEAGIYPRSQVGKIGIESVYDEELRGKEGLQIKERGIVDGRERIYVPQEEESGNNLYLTIDLEWQKTLAEILDQQIKDVNAFAGAGVIINSDTGEVKAMVSLPSYDNNLFSKGISNSEFSTLLNDPRTPLLNRPIGLQLPPGSIFKVIGATAGLETGVINRNTQIKSDVCMDLPGDIKFCEADGVYLGNLTVERALAKSSNIFFCTVALNLNSYAGGIDTLASYANNYGIGSTTGIDIDGEQDGTMATPELKRNLWNEPWYIGDECNAIIGQGLVTVTPLQMAVVMSTINNGGKVLQPHVLDRIEDQNGNLILEQGTEIVRELDVSSQTFEIIKSGMRDAVKDGTAAGLSNSPGNVIAKTGSADAAEIIQGELHSGAHSWVMGCFDYENENYCFVVMQQWGGRGYQTVPVMKKFINCGYTDFQDGCKSV